MALPDTQKNLEAKIAELEKKLEAKSTPPASKEKLFELLEDIRARLERLEKAKEEKKEEAKEKDDDDWFK